MTPAVNDARYALANPNPLNCGAVLTLNVRSLHGRWQSKWSQSLALMPTRESLVEYCRKDSTVERSWPGARYIAEYRYELRAGRGGVLLVMVRVLRIKRRVQHERGEWRLTVWPRVQRPLSGGAK